jgi:hypothetical protein
MVTLLNCENQLAALPLAAAQVDMFDGQYYHHQKRANGYHYGCADY